MARVVSSGSCSGPRSRGLKPSSRRRAGGTPLASGPHRRDHADPARPRHRSRRRSHYVAAVGRLFGARDHDGRRAPGVRRHRSGPTDARSRRGAGRGDTADAGDSCRCTCTVKPPTCSNTSPRDIGWRSSKTPVRPTWRPRITGQSARSAPPVRSASIRRRTLALSGTAARSPPATLPSRRGSSVLRNGGQSTRYRHDEFGVNSRLDEMQAAILRARLPFLSGWTERRRAIAGRYRQGLAQARVRHPARTRRWPRLPPVSGARRGRCRRLRTAGIETLIHYPVPIPQQPALASTMPADCPVANRVCQQVLSPRSTRAARYRRRRGHPCGGKRHLSFRKGRGCWNGPLRADIMGQPPSIRP